MDTCPQCGAYSYNSVLCGGCQNQIRENHSNIAKQAEHAEAQAKHAAEQTKIAQRQLEIHAAHARAQLDIEQKRLRIEEEEREAAQRADQLTKHFLSIAAEWNERFISYEHSPNESQAYGLLLEYKLLRSHFSYMEYEKKISAANLSALHAEFLHMSAKVEKLKLAHPVIIGQVDSTINRYEQAISDVAVSYQKFHDAYIDAVARIAENAGLSQDISEFYPFVLVMNESLKKEKCLEIFRYENILFHFDDIDQVKSWTRNQVYKENIKVKFVGVLKEQENFFNGLATLARQIDELMIKYLPEPTSVIHDLLVLRSKSAGPVYMQKIVSYMTAILAAGVILGFIVYPTFWGYLWKMIKYAIPFAAIWGANLYWVNKRLSSKKVWRFDPKELLPIGASVLIFLLYISIFPG